MRRFYASPESFHINRVTLNSDESKHLREVLRLRNGDEVHVFNGFGKEFACLVQEIGSRKSSAILKVISEVAPRSLESGLNLTLAAALLKGEKFDLVTQKAVELGVTKLVPLITKRCDVKIKTVADFDKKLERLQKIALDAAKQSGRAGLLKISPLLDFQTFIETAEGAKILFAERSGVNFSKIEAENQISAVVGAEGGWEDSEIGAAREQGFQIITLGGRILRAETAAISITTILQHRFGDLH